MKERFGWNIMYIGSNEEYHVAWFHFRRDATLYFEQLQISSDDAKFYYIEKGKDPE